MLQKVCGYENNEVPSDLCKKNFGGEVERETRLQVLRDEWMQRKQQMQTAAAHHELDRTATQAEKWDITRRSHRCKQAVLVCLKTETLYIFKDKV